MQGERGGLQVTESELKLSRTFLRRLEHHDQLNATCGAARQKMLVCLCRHDTPTRPQARPFKVTNTRPELGLRPSSLPDPPLSICIPPTCPNLRLTTPMLPPATRLYVTLHLHPCSCPVVAASACPFTPAHSPLRTLMSASTSPLAATSSASRCWKPGWRSSGSAHGTCNGGTGRHGTGGEEAEGLVCEGRLTESCTRRFWCWSWWWW